MTHHRRSKLEQAVLDAFPDQRSPAPIQEMPTVKPGAFVRGREREGWSVDEARDIATFDEQAIRDAAARLAFSVSGPVEDGRVELKPNARWCQACARLLPLHEPNGKVPTCDKPGHFDPIFAVVTPGGAVLLDRAFRSTR